MEPCSAFRRYAETADSEAFGIVVTAYAPMVMGVCRRVLGDIAAAEDAAQETFIGLARHPSAVRSNLGAWLYTTALNHARQARRGERRRERRERSCASGTVAMDGDAAEFDGDEHDLINACVAALADHDRDLISWRFFLGWTLTAIAGRLDTTVPAAHKRLRRALRALRYEILRRGLDWRDLARGGVAADAGWSQLLTALVMGWPMTVDPHVLSPGSGDLGGRLGGLAERLARTAIALGQAMPDHLAGRDATASTFRPQPAAISQRLADGIMAAARGIVAVGDVAMRFAADLGRRPVWGR